MKQELDWRKLDKLASTAKQIEAMPPGPARESARRKYAQAMDALSQEFVIPTEVIAPDAHLLGVIDWAEGLMRTGIGEVARGAVAAKDAMTGQPNAWTPGSAIDNAVSAIIPFGQPARDTEYYLDETGAGKYIPDVRISDIPGMAKDIHDPGWKDWYRVRPGGPADVSLKGFLGFAGDLGVSPKMAKAGWEKYKKIPATPEPVDQVLTMKNGKPATAAELRGMDELAREGAKRAGAQGMNMGTFLEGLKGIIVDPIPQMRDALHSWRFRHADKAAELAGKEKVSPIMRSKPGLKGVTTEGIRADMRKVIAENNERIGKIADESGVNDPGRAINVRRGTPDDVVEMNLGADFGSPIDVPVENRSLLSPLYGPEQMRAEASLVNGVEAQKARALIEGNVRGAEAPNAGLRKAWEEMKAAEGTPQVAIDPVTGEQMPLWAQPPERVVTVGPQVQIGGVERPLRTTERLEGVPAIGSRLPEEFDPLAVDRPINFPEVDQFTKDVQGELAERNWYNRRRDRLMPVQPGDQKAIAAEYEAYSRLAPHAAALREDLLDRAKPGAGAQARVLNKESSSLLEGGAWLDRAPRGAPTTRSMIAFAPLQGRAIMAAEGAANTGAMLGYKALRSPWTRYLVAPGARAAWLESIWDRQNDPSDGNPYALIYKHGVRP